MTQTTARWAHVLLGVGLTMVVAVAPLIFIVLSGASAEAGESLNADGPSSLLNSGLTIVHPQVLLALATVSAITVLALAVALTTRAQRNVS